ncbi:MAG: helix-turn-helix domain-containing protein [Plesiomonas sp.]|uniref:helix-turn-helix domain-containing protein n=1 Tax=Plesiomonas sp. TaxID=2486279 RepID=UPI003F360802
MRLNSVFARRLYLCHLLATTERPNIPFLMTTTGWPRRTLQDAMKALHGLGVEVHFVQDGIRNNDGYYQLQNWGPLEAQWVADHLDEIQTVLISDQP